MDISVKTKILGLFGDPVAHSLSPAMHNAAFRVAGLNYVYLPFHVKREQLASAIAGITALGIEGINVTIPHKEAVIPYLQQLTVEARLIGAVNTIVRQGQTLVGHNTDGKGFLRALQAEAHFNIKNKNIVLVGAGGAARAVAISAAMNGANRVNIINRSKEKAQKIVDTIRQHTACRAQVWELATCPWQDILQEAHLLVHTTPIGMYPQEQSLPPIPVELLHPGLMVCDLIYNPVHTQLLKKAKEAGCPTMSGLGMLVFQGAEAFTLWTGQKAPIAEMYRTVISALQTNYGLTVPARLR